MPSLSNGEIFEGVYSLVDKKKFLENKEALNRSKLAFFNRNRNVKNLTGLDEQFPLKLIM